MESTPPRSKLRKHLGLGLLLLGAALILTHELLLSVYQVSGVSMQPALQHGERVLVLKRCYEAARGDLLVFKNPNAPDEVLIKRVLFLPGERFEVRDGQALVAGQPVVAGRRAQLGRIPPAVVPSEAYFLVGDNLDESIDSRTLGAIPSRHVVGKVVRTLGR